MNESFKGMSCLQIAELGHRAQRDDDYIRAAECYREAARVAAWPQDHHRFKEAAADCDTLALTLQRA